MPEAWTFAEGSYTFRKDAVDLCLDAEAELHTEAVSAARACLRSISLDLLKRNDNAAIPDKIEEHWNSRDPRYTDVLELVRPLIKAGEQPIFASISFCLSSDSPTNFVPVPYTHAVRTAELFKRTLLVSDHDFENSAPRVREAAARTISHALLNISYSVRVDDDPLEGWLAAAHVKKEAIYLPNTSAAPGTDQVRTAAASEEPYLGMASVLYIPICDESVEGPAPAVLMLWSPCPRRWDGVVSQLDNGQIAESDQLRSALSGPLRWLTILARRELSHIRRAELEFISFSYAMRIWARAQGQQTLDHLDAFFHRTFGLVEYLARDRKTEHTPVRDWLRIQFCESDGLLGLLEWDSGTTFSKDLLECTPVLLRHWSRDDHATSIAELRSDLAANNQSLGVFLGDDLYLPFDRDISESLGSEPAKNILKHARQLLGIELTFTRKYVTLALRQQPTSDQDLIGSSEAFARYFAVRRGLAQIPTAEGAPDEGHGIGSWLYRIFSDHVGVFSKLHISPVGGTTSSVVTIRLARGT